jgi:hypothetical protein
MNDAHFYLLSKAIESSCGEAAEEEYILESTLVCLF